MKLKAFAVGLVAVSSLVACQAEQGQGTRDNDNNNGVQNTRFERTADDMYGQRNNANRYDNDMNMVHNTNYQVAKEAANNIEQNVKGVDRAYVLKTRDNAYVAAVMDNPNGEASELTDKVESQITKAVKKADNDIDNVYVSTNPDFVDLVNNYVGDVKNGKPVQGFFQEFGQMVERIFPNAK
ncbi:YhcN/YlaJ family sporulation lipoprotein [Halobacillus salinarum]|uniref:YhcN/YlaJ family sporulation lipoprotein n=1 Tax=Halobacillus salinarum TaxID=2932257 RepID=A0ABY4EGI3_9BACI|nr:YhcN/YlaJ family sporulation lipoprotein [Halobacillus salinarum]UOQ43584.1 YhcN/YlaJ family sporulation lipoprotein [Halobacillus salinarum]